MESLRVSGRNFFLGLIEPVQYDYLLYFFKRLHTITEVLLNLPMRLVHDECKRWSQVQQSYVKDRRSLPSRCEP